MLKFPTQTGKKEVFCKESFLLRILSDLFMEIKLTVRRKRRLLTKKFVELLASLCRDWSRLMKILIFTTYKMMTYRIFVNEFYSIMFEVKY